MTSPIIEEGLKSLKSWFIKTQRRYRGTIPFEEIESQFRTFSEKLLAEGRREAVEYVRKQWKPCEGMAEECIGKSREEIETILEEALKEPSQ